MQKIFTSETTNTNSTEVVHNGGEVEVIVSGTFGGATVTLYAYHTKTATWVPVYEGTWTESSVKLLRVVRPCSLRLSITGATGTTSINAWI